MNARNIVFKLFDACPHGELALTTPEGEHRRFGSACDGPHAEIRIHHDAFFPRLMLGGEIALGEAYIDAQWDSPDPTALIRWLIRNREILTSSRFSWALPLARRAVAIGEWIRHRRNANTLEGSRRNIEAHYDLGNDFYSLFLDESMTYSSAFFTAEEQTLQHAQHAKYERICRKLDLQPNDRVLEIGCGWGGFAAYAARNYGCRLTGVTISPSQLEYAQNRMQQNGLSDRVELRLQDYRQLRGQFDKIASIEMIEAVGHEYLPSYFASIDRLLAPEGLACIQIITSADHRYRSYRKDSDFIRKHIFPGSNLPSLASLYAAKGEADLNQYHMESFGLHYAATLRAWRERFLRQWPAMARLGFDEAFRRKWELYFCYCEAGFEERHINVAQVVFGRMNSRAYTFEQADRQRPPRDGGATLDPERATA